MGKRGFRLAALLMIGILMIGCALDIPGDFGKRPTQGNAEIGGNGTGADGVDGNGADGAGMSNAGADGIGTGGNGAAGNGAAGNGANGGTESELPPEPEAVSVTVTAVGDCSFGSVQSHGYDGSFWEYYDNKGPGYFFDGVSRVFEEDDFTVVNLECVLSEESGAVDKKWTIKGKPEYANILTAHSVEACGLGNNHSSDYGPQSLTDTKEAVSSVGVGYAYNGEVGHYTTENGISIGYVSVCLISQAKERREYMENGIKKLREEGADLVVALCHWGEEGNYSPIAYQLEMAHKCVDWGADLVIGSHPHVLQGMEVYEGKVICYSLGNFCFGGNSNPKDKNTMIFQQRFSFADGVLQPDIDAWVIPCSVSGHSGYNDYQPTIAEGEKKTGILNFLREHSKENGNFSIDAEGKIMVPPVSDAGHDE